MAHKCAMPNHTSTGCHEALQLNRSEATGYAHCSAVGYQKKYLRNPAAVAIPNELQPVSRKYRGMPK